MGEVSYRLLMKRNRRQTELLLPSSVKESQKREPGGEETCSMAS